MYRVYDVVITRILSEIAGLSLLTDVLWPLLSGDRVMTKSR